MKVKIADLRIGSHYSYDDDCIKLDGSLLATYLQNDTDLDLYYILLTEKWLLKFGFEKFVYDSEETGYGTDYKLKASQDVFMVYSDDFSLAIYSEESVEHKDLGVLPNHEHIKHVHQLQNLHFALTGEELTLKTT